jgi:DNA-directed RNA polymerase specialized sigma24 family protein
MSIAEADDRNRARGFPTTLWTLVVAAGQNPAGAGQALESLCSMYWFPLYGYARRSGYTQGDAEDLVQSYFTALLEKNYLSEASCERGRFRSFLLSSFKHFLSNQRDREAAAKRGGGRRLLPLEFSSGPRETSFLVEPSNDETPERIFDRDWALVLLEQVREQLKQEFDRKGKSELFDRIKSSLCDLEPEVPYALIASEMGMTESAVKVNVHRLRRRYRDILREKIAETVSVPEDVDEEIRFLFAALGQRSHRPQRTSPVH